MDGIKQNGSIPKKTMANDQQPDNICILAWDCKNPCLEIKYELN